MTLNETLEASNMIEAQKRLQDILHKPDLDSADNGPFGVLPPAKPERKKRSDFGIPKKPPADPDEIVLRLKLDEARDLALVADHQVATLIQDQIIAQLQKRITALQK